MSDLVRGAVTSSVGDNPPVPVSHRSPREREPAASTGTAAPRKRVTVFIVLAASMCFVSLCFAASFSSTLNSDGASFALAGWDMLHGNVLLRHWYMADAPFYALETPLYAVVEAFVGLGPTAARLVATLTYLIVALAAVGLAVRGAAGARAARRSAIVVLLLAAPLCFGGQAYLLLEMPTHLGTAAYLMFAFLVYVRWNGYLGGAVGLLAVLAVGQFEDATILYVGITAIVLIAASCVVQDRRLAVPELRMAAAAVLSYPCALVLRHIAVHFGSYVLIPPNASFASLSALPGNLAGTFKSLLFLYNVYQVGGPGPHTPQQYAAAVVGAAALAAGVAGFVRVLVRWRVADRVDRLAWIAVVLYFGTFALSALAADTATRGYEFIGVIPMFAILAARNLPELVRVPHRGLTILLAAAAAVVLATGALVPRTAAPWAPPANLAGWLKSHGLTEGIAGYWDAAAVTVDSGGRVQVRAVTPDGHGYQIYKWHTDTAWYAPEAADANFFIADPRIAGMGLNDAEAAYGAPSKAYSVDGMEILVYRANLFTMLN